MVSQSKINALVLALMLIYINPTISKTSLRKQKKQKDTAKNDIHSNDADHIYRINYAKKMLTYMNMSVDPCEDFYEFACGNWKNVIEKKPTEHGRSNILDIEFKIDEQVYKILQNSRNNLDVNYKAEFQLAQKSYQSCMSADLYTVKKSSEYLAVIQNIGGFPAVNKTWNPEEFSWFNMSADLTNYRASGLINEYFTTTYPFPPDFKLPKLGFSYIVHSENIASNTSKIYTMNEKQMRKYLTAYGVEKSKITKVISEIFDFWKAVLNITDQFEGDLEKCKLKGNASIFTEWNNFYALSWMGWDFSAIGVDCPCHFFYTGLDKICQNHKRAVANYLSMKFLFAMDAKLKSPNQQRDYCVRLIRDAMPFLIDKFYLKAYFSREIFEEVSTISKELLKSLRAVLAKANWLDESTRTEALYKESTIKTIFGVVEDNEMTKKYIRLIDDLELVKDNFYLNNLGLHELTTLTKRYQGLYSDMLNDTQKPMDLLLAAQANAFYYVIENYVFVPAGIFNPPVYHKAWPNSLKYGSMGFVISHEYTHAFFSTGAKFDGNSTYRNWWSNKTKKAFQEHFDCYVNHYNSYLIPDINRYVNGNQTIHENIADGGGLRIALNAYRNFMKKQSKEHGYVPNSERMPGMNLSPEQLFFLGSAQLSCASYEEEHFWQEMADEHTIEKYRVLGAVKNYNEFARAYKCSEKTKMNPKDKCRLW